jgi:hypothetical protein
MGVLGLRKIITDDTAAVINPGLAHRFEVE